MARIEKLITVTMAVGLDTAYGCSVHEDVIPRIEPSFRVAERHDDDARVRQLSVRSE